jgi:YggT family protein
MFAVGNFLAAIALVLHAMISTYTWIVIITALLSWVNPDPYNPIVRFLHAITEPVFRTVRRVLRLPYTGIDFSPLIVIFFLQFLDWFLFPTLIGMAKRLQ